MTVPITNTTCDIYRQGNSPPAAPDVAGVACYLVPKGQSTLTTQNYTHELWVNASVDIRDTTGPAGLTGQTAPDTVYVPNKNGSSFKVILVRRYGYGTAVDHLRILLQRQTINPPGANEVR